MRLLVLHLRDLFLHHGSLATMLTMLRAPL
jgi:hypothetical protein